MFLGNFPTKLTSNHQLSLTVRLRNGLGSNELIIAKGFDKCVYGFSPSEWQKIAEAELLKPLLSEEGRRMRQKVFSQAEEVDLDSQGRFVIPEYLMKYAELKEQVVLVGAGDHFEIWDKEEWEKINGQISYSSTFK